MSDWYRQVALDWMGRDPDPNTRKELRDLLDADDLDEVERRFSGRLAFGTAGLRGIIGAGPMMMNRLVVRESTAGLANYLARTVKDAKKRGVVIGFDGRRMSREFADDAAGVLAAQGFNAHLFESLTSTPTTAWAVTRLHAAGGIMITASHNPPAYNGYKVYWENGAQIIPPHDNGIAAAIDAVAGTEIEVMSVEAGRKKARIHILPTKLEAEYVKKVLDGAPPKSGKEQDISIVYTAMHGVGAHLVEPALAQYGFTNVHPVAEQNDPDGEFPTVDFPNPEEAGALDLAHAVAAKHDAHIILANDPDADRLAVAVPTTEGWKNLTGDQIGALFGKAWLDRTSGKRAVATTIVSSRLLSRMAQKAGATYFETLTGFKWIANTAMSKLDASTPFLFGYEEAIGYTMGELVRDKDGVSAALHFACLTGQLMTEGKTVLDALDEIYREFGVFLTRQVSLKLDPDAEGPSIPDQMREALPAEIAGRKVVRTQDISTGVETHADGGTESIELPKSNVLVFFLDDDSRVIVRPSGTEPKVKFYYEVVKQIGEGETVADATSRAEAALEELASTHQAEVAS